MKSFRLLSCPQVNYASTKSKLYITVLNHFNPSLGCPPGEQIRSPVDNDIIATSTRLITISTYPWTTVPFVNIYLMSYDHDDNWWTQIPELIPKWEPDRILTSHLLSVTTKDNVQPPSNIFQLPEIHAVLRGGVFGGELFNPHYYTHIPSSPRSSSQFSPL